MGIERRRQLLTEAIAGLNARDLDAYGRMFAEDVVVYTPGQQEPSRGRAARVQWLVGLLEAFPDGTAEVVGSLGDGDRPCAEFRFSGTHTGPLKGADGSVVAPTNARVSFPYCIVYTYGEDDLATEIHEYFDQVELLLPLGLLKPAGA